MIYRLFVLWHHSFRSALQYYKMLRIENPGNKSYQVTPVITLAYITITVLLPSLLSGTIIKLVRYQTFLFPEFSIFPTGTVNISIEPSYIMAKQIHQLRERLIFRFTSFPRIVRIQVYAGERQSSSNSAFWGTIWESTTKFVSLLKTNLGK
jgi:hypothetical protein